MRVCWCGGEKQRWRRCGFFLITAIWGHPSSSSSCWPLGCGQAGGRGRDSKPRFGEVSPLGSDRSWWTCVGRELVWLSQLASSFFHPLRFRLQANTNHFLQSHTFITSCHNLPLLETNMIFCQKWSFLPVLSFDPNCTACHSYWCMLGAMNWSCSFSLSLAKSSLFILHVLIYPVNVLVHVVVVLCLLGISCILSLFSARSCFATRLSHCCCRTFPFSNVPYLGTGTLNSLCDRCMWCFATRDAAASQAHVDTLYNHRGWAFEWQVIGRKLTWRERSAWASSNGRLCDLLTCLSAFLHRSTCCYNILLIFLPFKVRPGCLKNTSTVREFRWKSFKDDVRVWTWAAAGWFITSATWRYDVYLRPMGLGPLL